VAVDAAPAVGHAGPFVHAGQADVPGPGISLDPVRLEADAVVGDSHQQPVACLPKPDVDPGRPRVHPYVGERLLSDAIGDHARFGGRLLLQVVAKFGLEATLPRRLGQVPAQGYAHPVVVEFGRANVEHQCPQPPHAGRYGRLGILEALALVTVAELVVEHAEQEPGGRHGSS
jgi:hypothetical protein